MIEKSSTLYKMIILYMLERVDFPLTNSQITSFFLDNEYTTYFHVQQTIHDLLESKLIEEKKQGNNTCYQTTEDGTTTLSYFQNNISDQIRTEVTSYLTEKKYEMRNDNSIQAEYYRTPELEYVVQCRVMEKKVPLINLELTVPTEEIAKNFCSHWTKKNQEIYAYLMDALS
jgi:predicted transcriptional regulator